MKDTDTDARKPRPFLKWAGGKRQLLPELRKHYPAKLGAYHEPFVGGGAVFFDLRPQRAVLSDSNQELIDCYTAVRDRVEDVIRALKDHTHDKEHFYEVRDWEPDLLDLPGRAARMIFLNKTGFNGLYRVNSTGRFNVPYGRTENRNYCDEPTLRACAAALAGVEILCGPFDSVLDRAAANDFVYFDPPYVPVSPTAYFTAYQKRGFGMDDQERLAACFEALARRRVKVMLSNSDMEWIHDRYKAFHVRVVKARRAMNSDTSRRGPVGEVIVTSY
jgi:DNA adenine methylase